MRLDFNNNNEVIALLGAGSMGLAIVRRIAAGKIILLGDISEKNLEKARHGYTPDEGHRHPFLHRPCRP